MKLTRLRGRPCQFPVIRNVPTIRNFDKILPKEKDYDFYNDELFQEILST